ncbi:unnamed protein product [Prunus armeniaca]|uniref:Peptidase A1 domain-containing protein n=1 Tax=Prunus armeniaca TaxID=36596 RepID=A0A6J5WCF5_PRUAR|nr:unnamed protein product [Prunus armeniaca]
MVAVRLKQAVAVLVKMAAVLLFFFLISGCATTTATATSTIRSTITYPEFQELNVKETIAGTKMNIGPPTAAARNVTSSSSSSPTTTASTSDSGGGGGGKWKVKVVHRDTISLQSYRNGGGHTHAHLFHARMKRDAKRVASLMRRLSHRISSSSNSSTIDEEEEKEEEKGFGSEVVSGMEQGSGEYFVRIGVGSPPRSQYIVIDSGSDIVWVQCQPCSQCYHQSDPIFDPAHSASYMGVSCSSSVCGHLQNPGCHAGRCRYEASYGDGSYTEGTLALETLTLGSTLIQNVAIGCGHMNRGMFVGAAGLLGLGGGPMSFVGQLAGQTGGAFTYCLVSRGRRSGTGRIEVSGGVIQWRRPHLVAGGGFVPS